MSHTVSKCVALPDFLSSNLQCVALLLKHLSSAVLRRLIIKLGLREPALPAMEELGRRASRAFVGTSDVVNLFCWSIFLISVLLIVYV